MKGYKIKKWMQILRDGEPKDFWFFASLSIDILVIIIAIIFFVYGKPIMTELYIYINETCVPNWDLINYTIDNRSYNFTAINQQ